jgi:anti-sigma-K factor RskA
VIDLDRQALRDLAAAYVLGALEPDEARAFEARLAASDELRRDVAELNEVSGLLALGAPPVPRDDDALKRRLLATVRDAGGSRRGPGRGGFPAWLGPIGLAAAAGLALVAGVQAVQMRGLGREMAGLRRQADSLSERLAYRERTLDHIFEPTTDLILLSAPGARPPGIQLFWNRATRKVIVHAFNLPPADEGLVYQLWFLADGPPVPGGTFQSDPDGHALATVDGPAEGLVLRGAAVTIEPAGGSPQPTSPIIVSGAVGPD